MKRDSINNNNDGVVVWSNQTPAITTKATLFFLYWSFPSSERVILWEDNK